MTAAAGAAIGTGGRRWPRRSNRAAGRNHPGNRAELTRLAGRIRRLRATPRPGRSMTSITTAGMIIIRTITIRASNSAPRRGSRCTGRARSPGAAPQPQAAPQAGAQPDPVPGAGPRSISTDSISRSSRPGVRGSAEDGGGQAGVRSIAGPSGDVVPDGFRPRDQGWIGGGGDDDDDGDKDDDDDKATVSTAASTPRRGAASTGLPRRIAGTGWTPRRTRLTR